jgi:hypothetical protein
MMQATRSLSDMSKGGHLIFVLATIAIAPYVLPTDTNPDTAKSVDLLEGAERPPSRPATVKVAPAAPPSAVAQAPTWDAEPSSVLSETTVVTILQRPTQMSVALHQPPIPRGRDAIGRELQRELKRVGCYLGELNGAWTTSTRRAMRAFTDRVNAMLPTDEPDGILLALVQGHPDKVCGMPCPAGQDFNATGRCLPNGILARTGGSKVAATPVPAISAWTMTTVAGAPHLAQADTDRPDSAAIPAPISPATAPAGQANAQRRTTDRRRPPVSRERRWAYGLFRFSFN